MEPKASGGEVTCKISRTWLSSQQLCREVAARVKQEVFEDNPAQNPECLSLTRKCDCGNLYVLLTRVECIDAQCASVNRKLQSTFNEEVNRGQVCAKLLTAVINEDEQVESDPCSVSSGSGDITPSTEAKLEDECKIEVEDHVLYRFDPGLGKPETYDNGIECCKYSELLSHSARDVDEAGTFLDICNVKAEYDTGLVRQSGSKHGTQVEAFTCFRCNYSVTEKNSLITHMKRYHTDTAQKCSKTKRPRDLSVNTKTQHPFLANVYKCEEDHNVQNSESCSGTRQDDLYVLLTRLECIDAQGCSASLNCELQSTSREYKKRGSVCTKPLASVIKPVKNGKNHHGTESGSVFSGSRSITLATEVKLEEECNVEVEDRVLCKSKSELGKQKAYHKDTEYRKRTELREHSESDVDDKGKPCSGTSVDTSNVKAECDTGFVGHVGNRNGSQVEVFVCSRCNYSVTVKDILIRHVKMYHNDTVQKCSKSKRQKTLSVNTKVQDPLIAKPYKCTECDFKTKSKYYLTTHITIKHNSNAPVYQCAKCTYITKWKYDLCKHFGDVHNNGELYKCPHCDFATKVKRGLRRHVKLQHDPNARLYKCTTCDFATKHASSLKEHVGRRHNLDGDVYQCAKCKYKTKFKKNLAAHVKIHNRHAAFYKYLINDLNKCVKVQPDLNAKMYKCAYCNFATKRATCLTRHVTRRHKSDAPLYPCAKCTYTTKWNKNLSAHVRVLHNKNVKFHKCPHCGYATKYKKNLNKHVRVKHDPNIKLYNCTICNFRTKHADCLRRHVNRKHNSNAPLYHCKECDFAAKCKYDLTKHVTRKHNPHGPLYQCLMCTYASKLKAQLSEHIKVHHDMHAEFYTCPHCDHVTKYKKCLRKHVKVQHDPNAKLYKCAICDFETKHSYCLRKHVAKKHNPVVPVHRCA